MRSPRCGTDSITATAPSSRCRPNSSHTICSIWSCWWISRMRSPRVSRKFLRYCHSHSSLSASLRAVTLRNKAATRSCPSLPARHS
ncbi:Uncharacterised protein [Bordetella pertussis]|nr:Uncharacterised protein [Bordetella pertussis]